MKTTNTRLATYEFDDDPTIRDAAVKFGVDKHHMATVISKECSALAKTAGGIDTTVLLNTLVKEGKLTEGELMVIAFAGLKNMVMEASAMREALKMLGDIFGNMGGNDEGN